MPQFLAGFTYKILSHYRLSFTCRPTEFPCVSLRQKFENRAVLGISKIWYFENRAFYKFFRHKKSTVSKTSPRQPVNWPWQQQKLQVINVKHFVCGEIKLSYGLLCNRKSSWKSSLENRAYFHIPKHKWSIWSLSVWYLGLPPTWSTYRFNQDSPLRKVFVSVSMFLDRFLRRKNFPQLFCYSSCERTLKIELTLSTWTIIKTFQINWFRIPHVGVYFLT